MDAHVLDALEARVSALTGASSGTSSRLSRQTASVVGFVSAGGIISEPDATSSVGALNRSLGNNFWEDITYNTLLVGNIATKVVGGSALFNCVAMVVVIVVMVMALFFIAVGVSMATKNNKSEQVRRQTGTSNNENKLRLVDLGRFHESGQSFEDDGDAKGDEEDGVEEGT